MFEPTGIFVIIELAALLALIYLNYRAYKTGDRDLILIGVIMTLIGVSL